MSQLEHSIRNPGAEGPPLVTQVVLKDNTLRFVMALGSADKGLWRAHLLETLREELAVGEGRLRAPFNTVSLPPGLPMPTAIVATITTENHAAAIKEWTEAVLRAFRNLAMAHGVDLPGVIATHQVSSVTSEP
jgi:hypothetical protein